MTITAKIAAILLAIFMALFAGAWLILSLSMRPGFERLETEAHVRDLGRVQAFLQSRARDIQARTLDYAHLDDTYAFFNGVRPSYLVDNFPDEWFANYGVDLLAFADERGRLLWARGRQDDGAMVSSAGAARDLLENARDASPDPGAAVGGVAWTSDGPYLFSAARATRTGGVGEPRGYVILAKRVSRQALRGQVQLDLSLIPATSPPPQLAAHFASLNGETPETWTQDNNARSLIPLQDATGALSGAVLAERPRELAMKSANAMDLAVALFALMVAAALAVLWFLLRHMMLARIVRLERHLRAQSTADTLAPHEARPSKDEIGRLTDAYNALAKRLHDTAAREHKAILDREAAATANRMKSDFLANISHQLRTPLDSVIGYAELIEEELVDLGVSSVNEDLLKVRHSARHLITLVNEILDLSKIEAGRFEISPQSFMVEEMLHAALATAKATAREHNAKMSADIAKDLGTAYSDEQRLRQCLVSVLSQACAAAKDGEVSLRAVRAREGGVGVLRFEIRDSGPALAEAEAARVFDAFAPMDHASKRPHATDLSLAVTGRIMRLIGGSIDIRSDGGGSTFVLTVPASLADPALAHKAA